MYNHRYPLLTASVVMLLVIIFGCSGGGVNPTQPSVQGDGTGDGSSDIIDPFTALETTGAGNLNNHGDYGLITWDLYDIYWDGNSNGLVAVPARTADYTLNLLTFLQPPDGNPSKLLITLDDFSQFLTEGFLSVNFTLIHPFEPSWLTAFDVLGVIIGNGTYISEVDPDVAWAGANDLRLLNADGYTRWMNPVEFTLSGLFGYTEGVYGTQDYPFTATINSYKYYATGILPDETVGEFFSNPANLSNRGAWLPTSSVTRKMVLQFPMDGGAPVVNFQYGVLVHWDRAVDEFGDPIADPGIDDFPPTANIMEAVYIEVDPSGSTAWYVDEINKGGNLVLDLTIYDWQGELSPNGVTDQISQLFIEAPSGMIPGGYAAFSSSELLAAQTNSGPVFAQVHLEIPDVEPASLDEEILVTIQSADPDSYNQFGIPHPEDAHLAAFRRAAILILTESPNQPPVIDEMTGEAIVNCFFGEETYEVTAHDPDPGDTLSYKWEVTEDGVPPTFSDPLSMTDTCTVDWSDNVTYPFGDWDVWVEVSDGIEAVADHLDVTKTDDQLVAGLIEADPGHTTDVTCDVTGEYLLYAEDCEPTATLEFRFIRKHTTDDTLPDIADTDWSSWQTDPTWIIDWANTITGQWRIWGHVREVDNPSIEDFSQAYAVERVNTPPELDSAPVGLSTVPCESVVIYDVGLAGDCDSGQAVTRSWIISDTDALPPDSPSWTGFDFADTEITVDWSGYAVDIWYLIQKADDETDVTWNSLEVTIEEGTLYVGAPSGPGEVDCMDTSAEYSVEITICNEPSAAYREWGVSLVDDPGIIGTWYTFSDETFDIDWSLLPNGISGDVTYYVYVRAIDAIDTVYSPSFAVLRSNTPPEIPDLPSGQTNVDCAGDPYTYQMGIAYDCDTGDILTREWALGTSPSVPPASGWITFAGTSIDIYFAGYPIDTWYLWQRVSDTFSVSTCTTPLGITKSNTPPDVPSLIWGPSHVDCTMGLTHAYDVTDLYDCDTGQTPIREWGRSDTDDPALVTAWYPFSGNSFTVDFLTLAFDVHYFFTRDSDDYDTSVSDNFVLTQYSNFPPLIELIISGATDVGLNENPIQLYNVSTVYDCDPSQTITRYWGVNDTPTEPSTWTFFPIEVASVEIDWRDFGPGTWYLYHKAEDGIAVSISNPYQVEVAITLKDVVFAAPPAGGGSDANPGTWDQPVRSLFKALQVATASGADEIWLGFGDYNEFSTCNLIEGVHIYGCRDYDSYWEEDPGETTTIDGQSTAIIGDEIMSETIIRKLSIHAEDGEFSEKNSTCVWLADCTDALVFDECEFFAGDGYKGSNGSSGGSGAFASLGQPGEPGCENSTWPCGSCSKPHGGWGGTSPCGRNGGEGGDPGLGGANGEPGQNGVGEINGGDGGSWDNNWSCKGYRIPDYPANGDHGADGAWGEDGAGGNGAGSIVSGIWTGSDGGNGSDGNPGNGGGGGGGGAGGSSGCDSYGSSGGGGGGGGCAGKRGYGGDGAGGSFCVFCALSNPTFDTCTFNAGQGGDGGNGGWGGDGGNGGNGGAGGSYGGELEQDDGGCGGWGGDGGEGGRGGHGGGGGGGVSYCIYMYGLDEPEIISPTYVISLGGSGGTAHPEGNPGYDGDYGDKNW